MRIFQRTLEYLVCFLKPLFQDNTLLITLLQGLDELQTHLMPKINVTVGAMSTFCLLLLLVQWQNLRKEKKRVMQLKVMM